MIPLALQKKLLIAESELNRAQLIQEWQTLADEAQVIAHRAKQITLLASTAASVIAIVAALRHKKTAPAAQGKASWWNTLLDNTGLVSTIWQVFRAPGRPPTEK